MLHILAVIPYSIVGALQFSSGLRRRGRSWYRAAGRVLAVLGAGWVINVVVAEWIIRKRLTRPRTVPAYAAAS